MARGRNASRVLAHSPPQSTCRCVMHLSVRKCSSPHIPDGPPHPKLQQGETTLPSPQRLLLQKTDDKHAWTTDRSRKPRCSLDRSTHCEPHAVGQYKKHEDKALYKKLLSSAQMQGLPATIVITT